MPHAFPVQTDAEGFESRRAVSPDQASLNGKGQDDSNGIIIDGYAASFNVETVLFTFDGVTFSEVLKPGCFARSISKPDVVAVIEHDPRGVIARTPDTLTLREDNKGLWHEAKPPKTQRTLDLVKDIQARNIRDMSFLFKPVKQVITEERRTVNGKSMMFVKREVVDAELRDLTYCVRPAYKGTSVQATMDEGDQRSASALLPRWAREHLEAMESEQRRSDRIRENRAKLLLARTSSIKQ